jgi:TrmH family RNA methyltransferase
VKRLTSRQSPIVARFRAAARGGAHATILLDGTHLVADAVTAGVTVHDVLVSSDEIEQVEIQQLLQALRAQGIGPVLASSSVMRAVSPVRSPSPVVALARRPQGDTERLFSGRNTLLIIAADVQDPGNAGAIIRAAEAGGATGVVVAGQSADPFGWKALRGSMGSALRLPILICPSAQEAVAAARRHDCRIVAAVPRGGQSPYDVNLTGATAIVIGGEGGGLPDALVAAADQRVTIPMRPAVESLNAAVSAAILVYEAYRQRSSS